MRRIILEALAARYRGVIEECKANIEIYLRNPSGTADHPEVLDSIDGQIKKLTSAHERLEALEQFKNQ